MHLIRERGENVAVLTHRPLEPHLRRQHPRRQDAHGAAGGRGAAPSSARRPRGGHLGGVARRTRETMLLCEAAGYRQHPGRDGGRRAVRDRGPLHDRLLPAAHAGRRGRRAAGDQARHHRDARRHGHQQGRRRQRAARPSARASSTPAPCTCSRASPDGWTPRVLTCSALQGKRHRRRLADGARPPRPALRGTAPWPSGAERQALQWMNELVMLGLEESFRRDPPGGGALAGAPAGGARGSGHPLRRQPRAAGVVQGGKALSGRGRRPRHAGSQTGSGSGVHRSVTSCRRRRCR